MIDITQETDAWFSPNDSDGDEYLLRYTAPSKIKKFDGDMAILQHVIVDWKGIFSGSDPIPCTPENVIAFSESLGGARRIKWIMETAFNYEKFIDSSGNLLKNLQGPSNGGSTSRRLPAKDAMNAKPSVRV
jgi:hypothetical protein